VAAAVSVLYLLIRPQAPDLAAQLARAQAAARGVTLWWNGWYGGIATPDYSVLTTPLMRDLGVVVVGVLSTVAVAAAAGGLLAGSRRPRAGAAAAAAGAAANLYSGRVTFAVGMALALTAVYLLTRRRTFLALLMGAGSGLASPLAVLFLAAACGAVAVTEHHRRRAAVLLLVAAALPALGVALVFGQPSVMPFDLATLIPTLATCAVLCLAPGPRVVRVAALLSAIIAAVAFVTATPVGSNAGRLPMLTAAAVLVATGRWSRRPLVVAALALSAWPLINLVGDLQPAADASAQASYYQPLLAHLPAVGTAVQRLEVVDPRTHGADVYLPAQVPLARGWERQIDAASNPLFYRPQLTAPAYLSWLQSRAVGWVALPDAPLDYGAKTEARLVEQGAHYLRELWHGQHWRLFVVTDSAPMATGVASVTGLTDTTVLLHARTAGTAMVRVQYSQLLGLWSAANAPLGCVTSGPDSATTIWLPGPGDYRLSGRLSTLAGQPTTC